MLANGNGSDHCEQYSRLTVTTNHQYLKTFCPGVVDVFEEGWLRLPNEDQVMRLSREYQELGGVGVPLTVHLSSVTTVRSLTLVRAGGWTRGPICG